MDLILAAKIVEAEASILDNNGKLAVAQCIQDNNYNEKCFTTPQKSYSKESMDAVVNVFRNGMKRFPGWELLQFRSFKKYALPDGSFNWDKSQYLGGLEYIGKDGSGEWGHFYFGKCIDKRKRYCGTGIATAEAKTAINVRTEGNKYQELCGLVLQGQKVEVLSVESNGWLKIVWPGTDRGYAYTSNVDEKYYKI